MIIFIFFFVLNLKFHNSSNLFFNFKPCKRKKKQCVQRKYSVDIEIQGYFSQEKKGKKKHTTQGL